MMERFKYKYLSKFIYYKIMYGNNYVISYLYLSIFDEPVRMLAM